MNFTEEQIKIINEAHEQIEKNKNHIPDELNWWDGKQIDEIAFCEWFLSKHTMIYVGSSFYDIGGHILEEKVSKEILKELEPYIKTNISAKIRKILDVLKLKCMQDKMPISEEQIHFANGTFYIDGIFDTEKLFCANRLPVRYNPNASHPSKWMEFLKELLHPEDIITLQEFLGYCLIPTTKAQSMLMLIGKGGEGKSRIGLVMRYILGDNMNICSIASLSKDKFCRANQEGMLLMVDDDMQMEALSDTNILKAVITMEDKMDLEKKGKQAYQGYLYVRIMGFGNGTLTSLYDKSDGFYRRQIVIVVKERNPNRTDDKDLAKKLKEEIEGIIMWCLEGLKHLAKNNFHFTISDRTKQTLENTKRENDNLIDFFESDGYLLYQEDVESTFKDLYDVYLDWCDNNLERPYSKNTFSKYLRDNALKMGLSYKKNIPMNDGKYARGYKGISRCPGMNPFTKDKM